MKNSDQVISELKSQNSEMRKILERIVNGRWGVWASFVQEVKSILRTIP